MKKTALSNIEPLYRAELKRVYGFFYVKTFDQMLAEDLTQATFMEMVKKMHDPDVIIRDESYYLSGIMRNVWTTFLREKYRLDYLPLESIKDFAEHIDKSVEQAKGDGLTEIAIKYIAQLPEKQRVILHMRLVEQRSLKEIAEVTGKNLNYVRTTQKRGIASLRAMVQLNAARGDLS